MHGASHRLKHAQGPKQYTLLYLARYHAILIFLLQSIIFTDRKEIKLLENSINFNKPCVG